MVDLQRIPQSGEAAARPAFNVGGVIEGAQKGAVIARKLDEFPASAATVYPWRNGEVWQILHSEDYSAKTSTVISNARIQAKRLGGNVRTRMLEEAGRESIVLQFRAGLRSMDDETPRPPPAAR